MAQLQTSHELIKNTNYLIKLLGETFSRSTKSPWEVRLSKSLQKNISLCPTRNVLLNNTKFLTKKCSFKNSALKLSWGEVVSDGSSISGLGKNGADFFCVYFIGYGYRGYSKKERGGTCPWGSSTAAENTTTIKMLLYQHRMEQNGQIRDTIWSNWK